MRIDESRHQEPVRQRERREMRMTRDDFTGGADVREPAVRHHDGVIGLRSLSEQDEGGQEQKLVGLKGGGRE
jgi:hypothetical protein